MWWLYADAVENPRQELFTSLRFAGLPTRLRMRQALFESHGSSTAISRT